MDLIMSKYRRWNNITGWLMFLISAIVYLLTVEPTISFWDCGEFILAANKLQVGHPPGAPLFLMMGRIAAFFAGGDASKVPLMLNRFSALCSGLAIMFLFWTITHLVRRVFTKNGLLEEKHIIVILASGIIGSLAYTFSDTFWFSAVEGELYALSSLILGLVFWAMLKWEEEADEPTSGRWIILIAYIMGLGLGVHRLNLLVIPVLVFVYYFRKYEVTTKGFFKTLLLAVFLLWIMVFVLMPGAPAVAGWFELLLVNVFGLPYNSGLLFFVALTIAGLVFGIRYSLKRKKLVLNYVITCLAVIMIGYSSYAMIMIRSSAKPPMNQNNPSDVFSLSYYINMQQYGSSPKFFGNYYSAPVSGVKSVLGGYNKINGKYKPYYRPDYEYNQDFETIFPRMFSQESNHEKDYKYWGKVEGRKYSVSSNSGKETVVCPTFGENLRFFFRYQIGFMYMRYFMWNFAGRQNDIQGDGNKIYGNWISGISFIDEARLGNFDEFPSDLKKNPANNKYYFLPLIIGLAGLMWQYKKDRNGFVLVLAFFLMTGLAIILYLNQSPEQPRERDYAYAGSFYAFAIWIGFGFIYIHELLNKFLKHNTSAVVTFVILLVACPVLMGTQNWDDHDRSGRYTARDIGANYLESCAPNSILFTYGDNDSFPVWSVQDVLGIRQDVRVANLSYIQAGWYIDMMRQKAFKSDPMPLSLPSEKYIEGTRNQLPVNRINKPVNLKDVVKFAGQDDKKYMIDGSGQGDYMNYLPSNKLEIEVDTSLVLENGTVSRRFRNKMVSPMIWEYSDEYAYKGDLAIMDLLSTNGWKRPVYISTTVPADQYKGLEKFFIQEGLSYRIAPVRAQGTDPGEYGTIDPDVMYDNMMNKFKWGNAADPSVYLDENNRLMFGNFRRLFGDLGNAMLQAGDTEKAVAAIRKGLEIVPADKLPLDYFSIVLAEALIRSGNNEEGMKLVDNIIDYASQYLNYSIRLRSNQRFGLDRPTGINMQALIDIYNMSIKLNLEPLTKTVEPLVKKYYGQLYSNK
jgi:tetratricopeptide (TPR) repeat protein